MKKKNKKIQTLFYISSGKGFVTSKVYPTERLPTGVPNYDIIRLTAINSKGNNFIDTYVYPKEAVLIAEALLRAYTYCVSIKKDNLKPRDKERKK